MTTPYFLDDAKWAVFEAEARSWIGTPYRHMTAVKGRGVDCALFIANLLLECGVITQIDYAYYPPDWANHGKTDIIRKYMEHHGSLYAAPGIVVEDYADTTDFIRGDILLISTTSKKFMNHAVIYLGGDELIHSTPGRGVSYWTLTEMWKKYVANVKRVCTWQ